MIMKPPYIVASVILCLSCSNASGQTMGAGPMTRGGPFQFQGGKAIFDGACQACHMADAKGAIGAGSYPALVSDSKLAVPGYPIAVILHGQKAMPALGVYL